LDSESSRKRFHQKLHRLPKASSHVRETCRTDTETAHALAATSDRSLTTWLRSKRRCDLYVGAAYAKAKAKATLLGVEVIAPIHPKVLSNRWRKLSGDRRSAARDVASLLRRSCLMDIASAFCRNSATLSPAEARLWFPPRVERCG